MTHWWKNVLWTGASLQINHEFVHLCYLSAETSLLTYKMHIIDRTIHLSQASETWLSDCACVSKVSLAKQKTLRSLFHGIARLINILTDYSANQFYTVVLKAVICNTLVPWVLFLETGFNDFSETADVIPWRFEFSFKIYRIISWANKM